MHHRSHDQGGRSGLGGLGSTPSQWDTMGYGQQASGTHPTGMHSCFVSIGESKEKRSDRTPSPNLIQFLSFPCSFRQKFCQVIGWRTLLFGVGAPLWEIYAALSGVGEESHSHVNYSCSDSVQQRCILSNFLEIRIILGLHFPGFGNQVPAAVQVSLPTPLCM